MKQIIAVLLLICSIGSAMLALGGIGKGDFIPLLFTLPICALTYYFLKFEIKKTELLKKRAVDEINAEAAKQNHSISDWFYDSQAKTVVGTDSSARVLYCKSTKSSGVSSYSLADISATITTSSNTSSISLFSGQKLCARLTFRNTFADEYNSALDRILT